jgi:hypothetical protein
MGKQNKTGNQHFQLILSSILTLFFLASASAQTTTKGDDGGSSTTTAGNKKTKVLIIPWEPRMFNCNSDVTRAISSETGQKYNQIQEALRKGFADQLKKAFGANCTAITMLDDTAKMKADLHYIYTCTTISFTPVNFPLNPTKADSAKLKTATSVQKGQVQTTEDEADKFMNTIVISPNLLGYLKKKYGADYVVFINEVDIENELGTDPYNLQNKDNFVRSTVVHYTIFNTADGKRVAMGKSKSTFGATVNAPKKIIDGCLNTIAKDIYVKFTAVVKVK